MSEYSLGYCTNVHAGEDLNQYLASLERYTVSVRSMLPGDQELPIGLWLSARTACQILSEKRLEEFGAFLESKGLRAFTVNGFPYGNFHGDRVKYQVYAPDWTQTQRLDHTANLIGILARLMPQGSQAGISTLPLGWPSREFNCKKAAENLIRIAELLRVNELRTGKLIHLDIEPEPGCILSNSRDVVSFFKNYLLPGRLENDILRYIRVCHDISHASVVFEDQQAAISNYAANGIQIGKVHIASASEVVIASRDFRPVIEQLKTFQEDRYLHQTYIRRLDRIAAYEDLPLAIRDLEAQEEATLRCHFHVPIFIERFGHLKTTRYEIVDCLENIYRMSDCRHFEVETYAWTVLPDELKVDDLTQGIARELLWAQEELEKIAISAKPIAETIASHA
ncbi:MAG: metabolite traffic protein EboE [Planctomycetota bacterium]|jgi:hypothetical protein